MNNTVFAKCHRQSIYLANRFLKEFYDYGYILGNNKNAGAEKDSVGFPGALVGDPTHNSLYAYIWVDGRPTWLANNLIDFDKQLSHYHSNMVMKTLRKKLGKAKALLPIGNRKIETSREMDYGEIKAIC